MHLATTDRPSPLMGNSQVEKLYMEPQIRRSVLKKKKKMLLLSGYAGS